MSKTSKKWDIVYPLLDDLCDDYGCCGANNICRIYDRPICECLEGFVPKSQEEWEFQNWTSGWLGHSWIAKMEKDLWNWKGSNCLTCWNSRWAMTFKKCEEECFRKCSCTTYANSNISEGDSGPWSSLGIWSIFESFMKIISIISTFERQLQN